MAKAAEMEVRMKRAFENIFVKEWTSYKE